MTIDDPILLPEGSRIVHIGPPKTGTTSLQAAFHIARLQVEAQGVLYASQGRHAMSAVLAGIDQPSPWAIDRKPPSKVPWGLLLGSIRGSSAKRVVLSSEFFADASPAAIRKVVDEIGPERIQIVVTLRPLARIIPSQWQQFVQNQLTTPFDEWLDAQLNQPRGTMTPVFWRRHRHDELIARWAKVVGPERVTAVALDDTDYDMILRVFERLSGLTEGTLVAEPDLANRSMTMAEIEIVRAFNQAFVEEELPGPLYSRVMRFGAAAHIRGRKPDPDEPRIELPAWSIDRIEEIAREMMAAIRASGVRVVGDLDALTTAIPGPEAGEGTVNVTPTVAARAAMGVVIASGLARGSGRITVSEEDGVAGDERVTRAPRPVQEPPELLRLTTQQIAIVILRRARVYVVDKISGLFRRS